MTGTRMYGIGDGVDEEHVDAYCCPSVKSQHQEDSACNSNCAAGLIISPRIIIHIPNLVLVGVYLLKPTKRRTIKVCPRTVRMYANAQISGVFPDIVRTGSEVHFCRCPDTGLALASVPIRCVRALGGKLKVTQLSSTGYLGQFDFCAIARMEMLRILITAR
uniref:Uncharacterized protein n=1 Tax=Escherichia coli TaxID=562 RepID=A0A1U9XG23_ECOLX|nr:hypothetical protein H13_00040 [Escherichia coli]